MVGDDLMYICVFFDVEIDFYEINVCLIYLLYNDKIVFVLFVYIFIY